MKRNLFTTLLAASGLLLAQCAIAQDIIGSTLRMAFTDVAELKQKAEAGDPGAQLAFAKLLAGQFRSAEALLWYRKAAEHGSLEAVYQIGRLLLFGGMGGGTQSVKPDPSTGIQLIFCAATNRYIAAYRDMHRAYRDGLGVRQDTTQAYAWLQLHADSSGGLLPSSSRAEMNALALKVDVATSQEAKRLAALYKSGHWPVLEILPPAAPDPPPQKAAPAASANARTVPAAPVATSPKPVSALKVSVIALGAVPLAVINGKTLAEGESVTLPLKPTPITIKCLKIEKNSVLVAIDGEDTPRELYLH